VFILFHPAFVGHFRRGKAIHSLQFASSFRLFLFDIPVEIGLEGQGNVEVFGKLIMESSALFLLSLLKLNRHESDDAEFLLEGVDVELIGMFVEGLLQVNFRLFVDEFHNYFA